ncbi:hypothetical protein DXX93_08790 [Thalassotalea euphylliae]|uniref:Uncharacterized protein n=1 Tax=Thalassotalea euphylliae TaxID=1655234 RepID=A0A3E0TRW5_9GAMM|nr:hypothetical protein DXX93_08790 [Thalassotalea euphylliae]
MMFIKGSPYIAKHYLQQRKSTAEDMLSHNEARYFQPEALHLFNDYLVTGDSPMDSTLVTEFSLPLKLNPRR